MKSRAGGCLLDFLQLAMRKMAAMLAGDGHLTNAYNPGTPHERLTVICSSQ